MNTQVNLNESDDSAHSPRDDGSLEAEPPHPVNWNLLTSHDLEQELLELNRWVNWLRLGIRAPSVSDPTALAPTPRAALGTVCAPSALALRL